MKFKLAILICLVGLLVLPFLYEQSWANTETAKPALAIGVVNIQKIFENCKKATFC